MQQTDLLMVRVEPDYDDGDEADNYEEDVEGEEQAVYDETHLHPLLWALAGTQLLLHLEADGQEVPTKAPQHLHSLAVCLWLQLFHRRLFAS